MQTQGYARTILVPLANPRTAPILLEVALGMAEPENGKVLGLVVSVGDAEGKARATKALQPIVDHLCSEKMAGETQRLQLISADATSISRGILDTVREYKTDLIILGVKQAIGGEVILGTVAENVADTAPCDVLIYRDAHTHEFKRVVFWADGTADAQIAARVAIVTAQHYQVPVEAIYLHLRGISYWQGLARVEKTLENLPNSYLVKRSVMTAQNNTAGLVARLGEDDLFILGFERSSEAEKWLFGDFSRELLNRVSGPMILTSRRERAAQSPTDSLRDRLALLTPTLTRVEQDDIVRQARDMSSPNLDYLVLIFIAALLASLGLLLNSAAVIIGAMLVAPLMQPIVSFSVGVATGRLILIERSILSLILGVLLAGVVSICLGVIIPLNHPTTEMLGRGSPSLLDAGVAFASGLIGGYATARKNIPAALAGVAIAAALMPPLCTVGLGLAFGEPDLALGAFLLFITNIAYISLAALLVFFWLGMRPSEIARIRRISILFLLVVLSIPLLLVFREVSNRALDSSRIETMLEETFAEGDVLSVEIYTEEPLRVVATIRSSRPIDEIQVASAESDIEKRLEQDIQLEVVYYPIITPK